MHPIPIRPTGAVRHRGWVAVVGALMALVGAVGVDGAVADTRRGAFPGANGRIVTARAHVGGRHEQIVTVEPDGGSPMVLTDFRYGATEPSWSADGRRIVFVKRTGPALFRDRDIWTMNADGARLRRVTDTAGAEYSPSWSPDRTRIVYERGGDIYTVGADGSGRARLTDTPRRVDVFPTWSPDGTRIAYSSWLGGSFASQEIVTMDPNGSNRVQVTNNEAASLEPSWAPSGTRLVFQYLGGGNEIAVVDVDGSDFEVLTETARDEFSPVWSPDGERIAFAAGPYPDGLDLYTMAADGTDEVAVTSSERNWFDWPDWQPLVERSTVAPWSGRAARIADPTAGASVSQLRASSRSPRRSRGAAVPAASRS